MKKYFAAYVVVLLLICSNLAVSTTHSSLDIAQIHKAAADSKSMFLDETGRVRAVDTFVQLVRIKGPSGKEQEIQKEIKKSLHEKDILLLPKR